MAQFNVELRLDNERILVARGHLRRPGLAFISVELPDGDDRINRTHDTERRVQRHDGVLRALGRNGERERKRFGVRRMAGPFESPNSTPNLACAPIGNLSI
jgi:hypothetical protein